MGGPYKRKKYHYGDTHLKKGWRTRVMTRGLDQIDSDLSNPATLSKKANAPIDFDKAGLGQFNCVHCSKDFISEKAFTDHVKSKKHKRRLHALKTEPYTIEESERAAGMGSYIQPKKNREMKTILPSGVLKKVDVKELIRKRKFDEVDEEEVVEKKAAKKAKKIDSDDETMNA